MCIIIPFSFFVTLTECYMYVCVIYEMILIYLDMYYNWFIKVNFVVKLEIFNFFIKIKIKVSYIYIYFLIRKHMTILIYKKYIKTKYYQIQKYWTRKRKRMSSVATLYLFLQII